VSARASASSIPHHFRQIARPAEGGTALTMRFLPALFATSSSLAATALAARSA
jgi:hypothetical protein